MPYANALIDNSIEIDVTVVEGGPRLAGIAQIISDERVAFLKPC